MGKRRRILLVALFAATSGLLAWLVLRSREPLYQGKPLGFWLQGFESDVPEARWQSADAMRHIGTNAMPFLIARLRHKPSGREPAWKPQLRALLEKQSIIRINLAPPANERRETLAALDALGPVAKNAIPALEALLHESRPDPDAVFILGRLGPEAKPALTRALKNDVKVIRMSAHVCLQMLQTNSGVLFPKTAADAEFNRRLCEFHVGIMNAGYEEYRAHHPEQVLPNSLNAKPPSNLPPGLPRVVGGTNL